MLGSCAVNARAYLFQFSPLLGIGAWVSPTLGRSVSRQPPPVTLFLCFLSIVNRLYFDSSVIAKFFFLHKRFLRKKIVAPVSPDLYLCK